MAIEILKFVRRIFTIKFLRYTLVGGISTGFSLLTTVLITEYFGVNYLIPYGISLAVVTGLNFLLAIKVIFKVNELYCSRFFRYLFVYVTNLVLVKVTEEYLRINYAFAIFAVTITLFLVKFTVYDCFVFNKAKESK